MVRDRLHGPEGLAMTHRLADLAASKKEVDVAIADAIAG
jgi:hypothetical protein